MRRLSALSATGIVLGITLLAVGVPASAGHSQRDHAEPPPPDPRTCDRFGGSALLCTSRQTPRAGHLFTGGYVWIAKPAETPVRQLTCDAKLGGQVGDEPG